MPKTFYIDRRQAESFGVSYTDSDTRLVIAADALLRSKDYDQEHRDLLKPLGQKTIVAKGQGYGWFEIVEVL